MSPALGFVNFVIFSPFFLKCRIKNHQSPLKVFWKQIYSCWKSGENDGEKQVLSILFTQSWTTSKEKVFEVDLLKFVNYFHTLQLLLNPVKTLNETPTSSHKISIVVPFDINDFQTENIKSFVRFQNASFCWLYFAKICTFLWRRWNIFKQIFIHQYPAASNGGKYFDSKNISSKQSGLPTEFATLSCRRRYKQRIFSTPNIPELIGRWR